MKKYYLFPAGLLILFSCTSKSAWPEEDQKDFMDICEQAMYDAFDRDTNFEYCACMLEKIMDEYPDPNEQDDVSDETIMDFATGCFEDLGIEMPQAE